MAARSEANDPMQARVNAAQRLARLVAGDDDARFIRTVQAVLNAADAPELQGAAAAPRTARGGAGGRRRAAARPDVAAPADVAIPADSIFSDPRFLENAKWLLANRRRIVGGVRSTDFPDCVAVGTDNDWCCSGTLVAPTVVVTAGHCVGGGCASRVFVGTDVSRPRDGRAFKVAQRLSHPGYRPPRAQDDIAVLILAEPVRDVAPRRIAPASALTKARSVRVVGYGNTDNEGTVGYGIRRLVDVPMADPDPRFGADPKTEFVAGAPFLDRDSCSGDSGGPAYVQLRSGWALAGATSRSTATSLRTCGDGGVYTTVAAFEDWLGPFIEASGGSGSGSRPSRRTPARQR